MWNLESTIWAWTLVQPLSRWKIACSKNGWCPSKSFLPVSNKTLNFSDTVCLPSKPCFPVSIENSARLTHSLWLLCQLTSCSRNVHVTNLNKWETRKVSCILGKLFLYLLGQCQEVTHNRGQISYDILYMRNLKEMIKIENVFTKRNS